MEELVTNKWKTEEPLFISKEDERYGYMLKELKEDGFCESETWSLGHNIAEFVLPRLKRFREIKAGYPMGMTSDSWGDILDKMIFSFEWALKEDDMTEDYKSLSYEEKKVCWEKYEEGMKLFSDHMLNLWW